jgi:hypothetical protein
MTRLAPRTIISCPHCPYLASKTSVTSFTTGDLTRWSDGYTASWFGQPFFTRCTACRGVYWVDDASVVGNDQSRDADSHRPPPGWIDRFFGGNRRKMEARTLSDDLFGPRPIVSPDIDAIVTGVEAAASGSKEREQIIRRLLWWPQRNLKYPAIFAQHCPDGQFGQQPADQLPWFHAVTLLTRFDGAAEREWQRGFRPEGRRLRRQFWEVAAGDLANANIANVLAKSFPIADQFKNDWGRSIWSNRALTP